MNYPIFIEVTLRNTQDGVVAPKRVINACYIRHMVEVTVKDETFTSIYFDDSLIKVKETPKEIRDMTRAVMLDYIRLAVLAQKGIV